MGDAARSLRSAPVDDRRGVPRDARGVVGPTECAVATGMKTMRLPGTIFLLLILSRAAVGQTTKTVDDQLDFGTEGLTFPPVVMINGHTPRTAQLLGEAYRQHEPLVWKRVQYVSDLGQVRLPETSPYLTDAMKDASPAV